MLRFKLLLVVILFHVFKASSQAPAGALGFNGTSSYVHVANHDSLEFASNFTVEAWIKPSIGGGFLQTVLSKTSASGNSGFRFPITTDQWMSIGVEVFIGGQRRILSAPNFNPNAWIHTATTYDGNTLKLYINGLLMSSGSYTGTLSNNTDSLFIGLNREKSGKFKGQLDEVRIWGRALSDCEIQQHMSCQLSLPQTGLMAYYRFNQGFVNVDNTADNVLADSSGNGINGSLSGFSLLGTTDNWVAGTVTGTCSSLSIPIIAASADDSIMAVGSTIRLHSSGSDNYSWTGPNGFSSTSANPEITSAIVANSGIYHVSTTSNGCVITSSVNIVIAHPASGIHSSGGAEKITVAHGASLVFREGFTVEAWIKPSSAGVRQVVLEKGFSNGVSGFEFIGTDDGWSTVSMKIKVNNTPYVITAPFPGLNGWQHVAGVYDGSRMLLYINGVLLASSQQTFTVPQNTDALIIGNNLTGDAGFGGVIEEVRIWNRPLSACEIETKRGSEINATYDNLVAYYKFNEGLLNMANSSDTILPDATAHLNNGVLTGFNLTGTSSNWLAGKYINEVQGGSSFSLVASGASVTHAVNYIQHEVGNCEVIAKIVPTGGNPVAGDCTSQVWVESGVVSHGSNTFAKRHYQLTPSANASIATGTVTLYFTQADFDHYNNNVGNNVLLPSGPSDTQRKSNIRIAKFTGSSSDGSGLPASYSGVVQYINPNDDSITWNPNASVWEISFAVDGFSGFFLQASLQALPLTWGDFTISKQHSGALLKWETADEVNTHLFNIEHRSDKSAWKVVGSLQALGYQASDNSYAYFHPYPAAGINQYRIAQYDIDNSVTYSPIRTVKLSVEAEIFKIVTNPTNGKRLKIYLQQADAIRILSPDGRLLIIKRLSAGLNEINLNQLPSGYYMLRVGESVDRFLLQ
jgi:hypothetical protein